MADKAAYGFPAPKNTFYGEIEGGGQETRNVRREICIGCGRTVWQKPAAYTEEREKLGNTHCSGDVGKDGETLREFLNGHQRFCHGR